MTSTPSFLPVQNLRTPTILSLIAVTYAEAWNIPALFGFSLVYNTKEKFEKCTLFLWLGQPSTLIRHEKEAFRMFRKRTSNKRNLKTPPLRFRVDGNHFENKAFRKRCRHDNHVTSLPVVCSHTNPKWLVITVFFLILKFLRHSVDRKHLMRF